MKKLVTVIALSLGLLASGATPVASAQEATPTTTQVARATVTKVHLKVGKKKTRTVRTTAATVGELLTRRHIAVDADDIVSPSVDTALTRGLKIRVTFVSVATVTVTEKIPFETVIQKTDTLSIGERQVVKGTKGSATRTYTVTRVNGKVTTKVLVSETVVTAAVTQTLLVGTNEYSNGHKLNLARLGLWNRIARCESGGNWRINTGNGYYGGLQFSLGTWRSNGGRDFAAKPHRATKAEQITVANRLYKKSGTRAWGCA